MTAEDSSAPGAHRLRELEVFAEATRLLSSTLDLGEVLDRLARGARERLGVDLVRIWLRDRATGDVVLRSQTGTTREHLRAAERLAPGEGLVGWVLARREPLVVSALPGDARLADRQWFAAEGIESMMVVPLLLDGEPVGVLSCLSRTRREFADGDLALAAAVAAPAALAVRNAAMHAEALEEERRRAAETSALLDIARASTSTLDLRTLLAELARRSAQALEAERCTISLWRDGHLVPVMAQFADGRQDPELWAKFRELGGAGLERVLPDLETSRTGQAVVVPDTAGSSALPADWVEAFGVRSLLVTPLISKDRVIGALSLDDTHGPRPWTAGQVNLAVTIAAQVALTLDTARQHSETQRRAAEVEALATTGEALASTLELQPVLDIIADSALRLVGARRAVVFELDQDGERLHATAVRGIDVSSGLVLRLGQGAAGTAALTRAPVSSADVLAEPPPGYDQLHEPSGFTVGELVRGWGYRAVLAVPVLSRDRVLGSVSVFWDEVHRARDREVRLLSALARQAAIAMDKARLVGDLRRTLTELQTAQESLVRGATLRAVGELATGATHHLNNLLAVVLGRTQLLLMGHPAPAARRGLETIERAAMEAAETVRRIQAFGRTEPDAQVAPFDVNAVVDESLALTRLRWQDEAQARGLRIDVAFERGAVPCVPGRAAEIREVVANLILNAVDAVVTGGRLLIRTTHEPGRVMVTIGDSGTGMSDEVRRRAFEPFFTTKGVKRTGLGLAVAYGTIRRHGGEITLDSVEGQGTTVSFWLPTRADAAAAVSPPAGERGTLLVVDDDPTVRDILVDVLRERGHVVAAAGGGREALSRLEAGRYDLVLTDLGMPDMTGWEVARAAKAMRPGMPALLVTGWGDELEPPPGVLVDGIITKPFDVTRLSVAVEEALRRSRRAAASR